MSWPRFVKLNKEFNKEILKQEVADIASDGWKRQTPFFADNVPGINTTVYHDGGWSVLSLRSLGADNDRTDPGGPNFREYAYTDYLDKAPYLRSILAEFGDAIRTVRLSRMEANQSINYHADTFIGFQYGQLRLHIPITTNEHVKMYVDDEASFWAEGELWFADFARRHKVDNLSNEARVHLILDVYLTDYVLSLFPEHIRADLVPKKLLMHQESISLSPEILSSYECQFKVSAALIKGVFETDDGIDGQYLGRVALDDNNELLFSLAGKPLFHLQPIEVGLFKIKSWAMERTIEFQKNESGRVEVLKMNFHCANDTSTVIIRTVK
jgi:aspartate beta-hydroxylase